MIPEDLKKPKQGGRPSNHSVLLSINEFSWLRAKLNKKVSLLTVAKDSPKRLKDIIVDLADKVNTADEATSDNRIPVKLNKPEFEVVSKLVENEVTALTAIATSYATRHVNSPRRDEVTLKLDLLAGISEKMEKIKKGKKK